MLNARRRTVVIADDHPHFLAKIRSLVQAECEVLATLDNGRRAVDVVCSLKPDIVILDISMPVLDGFAAAREIREFDARTQIVFLSTTDDAEYAIAARELDATFVVKRRMHLELLKLINVTNDGSRALYPPPNAPEA